MLKRYFCIFFGLLSGPVFASFPEISSFQNIVDQLKSGSLREPIQVVFDLHGTLLEARQMGGIGSDGWVYDMVSRGVPFSIIVRGWREIQTRVNLSPINKDNIRLFNEIKSNWPTIVLSGGLRDLTECYDAQLNKVSASFFNTPSMKISVQGKQKPGPIYEVIFNRGILAVGPEVSKGEALRAYFKQIHSSPKTVIAVDDQVKYLTEFQNASSGIDFLGFKFKQKTQSYDPKMAKAGLERFTGYLPSDSACAEILAILDQN